MVVDGGIVVEELAAEAGEEACCSPYPASNAASWSPVKQTGVPSDLLIHRSLVAVIVSLVNECAKPCTSATTFCISLERA
jgi:hypothetical protein